MSRLSLREWIAETELQLAGGQAAEALSRCRRAVELFPRCLAIYSLLGQSLLSSGQYPPAADIFLRLLSSLPDDFAAHLALSLIRESEGNLDLAAWHIARACEAKPASQAVRLEAARLEALRPPAPASPAAAATQIIPPPPGASTPTTPSPAAPRLSRVALARLYLQGKSYPQAIAELHAALRENPERLDLPVLLAQACFQSGQLDQARAASQSALQKLPFSLHANRIAFLVATQAGQTEQALPFRQRLQELDPYWAYVTPAAPDAALVPDHAVMLDNL